jgi:hypothetical protein
VMEDLAKLRVVHAQLQVDLRVPFMS